MVPSRHSLQCPAWKHQPQPLPATGRQPQSLVNSPSHWSTVPVTGQQSQSLVNSPSHRSTVPVTSQQLRSPVISYSHRSSATASVVSHIHRSSATVTGHQPQPGSSATFNGHRQQSPVISQSQRRQPQSPVICHSQRRQPVTGHQLQSLFINYSYRSSPAVGPIAIGCPDTPAVSHPVMGLPATTAVQQLQPSSGMAAVYSAVSVHGEQAATFPQPVPCRSSSPRPSSGLRPGFQPPTSACQPARGKPVSSSGGGGAVVAFST
jgi:hypothetical protein